jgi:hypothetical protein
MSNKKTEANALATSSLAKLAEAINTAHDLCERAVQDAVGHAKRTGELLLQAKGLVAHGQWLPWLEANCRVEVRQAQRYMRLAAEWDRLVANASPGTHLSLKGAMDLLAEPREEPAGEGYACGQANALTYEPLPGVYEPLPEVLDRSRSYFWDGVTRWGQVAIYLDPHPQHEGYWALRVTYHSGPWAGQAVYCGRGLWDGETLRGDIELYGGVGPHEPWSALPVNPEEIPLAVRWRREDLERMHADPAAYIKEEDAWHREAAMRYYGIDFDACFRDVAIGPVQG